MARLEGKVSVYRCPGKKPTGRLRFTLFSYVNVRITIPNRTYRVIILVLFDPNYGHLLSDTDGVRRSSKAKAVNVSRLDYLLRALDS